VAVVANINLYDSTETVFTHNGLVVLSDCKVAFVDEELNGKYELEIEYPIDRRGKWQHLTEGNILKADGQIFRIYHKEKTLTGIKANARHIFYDLLDNFIESATIGNLNAAGALSAILSNTQYAHDFTSMSDIATASTYAIDKQNPVEAIMGDDGVISRYGGELVRDNYTVRLYAARGLDRDVLVSYGKNIIGIEETLDMDSVCTRVFPVGKDGLLLTEKYLDSTLINSYPHPIIKMVEFNDCETENALRTAGQVYLDQYDKPIVNYSIDFIELTKTEEYKNYSILETVYMGDTVTVRHTKLNINIKAKVIRIKKNILTNRIEEVELGSFRLNISNAISKPINDLKRQQTQDKTDLQAAIDNATEQINSALGGYVVKRNGELLIMDTEDINTATKVWRWNQGGLGYSGTGYNGPFATAITADGHIVADFVDTGTLSAGLVKTGTITSATGKLSIGLDDEVLNIGGKIVYDGATGAVTFDPSVVLSWNNIDPNTVPPLGISTEEAIAAWAASGYATYIGANGIYTGTLTAQQIMAIEGITTLNITGTLNCGETLEIGPENETGGQCHLNTALEAIRVQAHVPGNYLAYWDDGGLSFFVNNTSVASVRNNGTTNLKPDPVDVTAITYRGDGAGFDTDLDGAEDSWTWTKDGNGRITRLESSGGRIINVTY
jgi:phage minor structural protein